MASSFWGLNITVLQTGILNFLSNPLGIFENRNDAKESNSDSAPRSQLGSRLGSSFVSDSNSPRNLDSVLFTGPDRRPDPIRPSIVPPPLDLSKIRDGLDGSSSGSKTESYASDPVILDQGFRSSKNGIPVVLKLKPAKKSAIFDPIDEAEEVYIDDIEFRRMIAQKAQFPIKAMSQKTTSFAPTPHQIIYSDPLSVPTQQSPINEGVIFYSKKQSLEDAPTLEDEVKACFKKTLGSMTPQGKTEELSKMKKEFIGVLKIFEPDYNPNSLNDVFKKFAKIAQNPNTKTGVKFSDQESEIVSLFLNYVDEKNKHASENGQSEVAIDKPSSSLGPILSPIEVVSTTFRHETIPLDQASKPINSSLAMLSEFGGEGEDGPSLPHEINNLKSENPKTNPALLTQGLPILKERLADLNSYSETGSSPLYAGKATKEQFLNLCVDKIISELDKGDGKVYNALIANIPLASNIQEEQIANDLRNKDSLLRVLVIDKLINSVELHQDLEKSGVYLLRNKPRSSSRASKTESSSEDVFAL